MKTLNVTDPEFKKYGRVVDEIDFSGLIEALKEKTPCPEDCAYEPSIADLESLPVKGELERIIYGELPIQIGYCNGHNLKLNAVEYHRSSEINVAATDVILLLGKEEDIEEGFTYDTGKMEAFLLPAGKAVELYATSLHYAPCQTSEEGFRVSIVLPKGTNEPLTGSHGGEFEDSLITARNKWLIGHPEGGFTGSEHIGLKGENLEV
ncbi:MAG: DUF4867 family protein [Lachnospiraceae bacterium]|nr:DUF4867 family protein [Lachnospiraceae bacterium]